MKTTRLVLCLVCIGAMPVADSLAGNKHGKHASPSILPSVPQMPKFIEAGLLPPRTVGPTVPSAKLPAFETPVRGPALAPAATGKAPASAGPGTITAPRTVNAHETPARELKAGHVERGRPQSREFEDRADRATNAKTQRLDRSDSQVMESVVKARRNKSSHDAEESIESKPGEDQKPPRQADKVIEQDVMAVAKNDTRDLPACR